MSDEITRNLVEEGLAPGGPDEYFASQGIIYDELPGCFVCGGPLGVYDVISARVRSKEAGERIVAMFKQGARLGYNDFNIKVGACKAHLPNLDALHQFTQSIGNRLPEWAVKKILVENFNPPATRTT